jgi:hypothetical protein
MDYFDSDTITKVISVIVVFLVISGLLMLSWNIVISDIFTLRRITYIEAIVLNFTIRFLFQSVEFQKDKIE